MNTQLIADAVRNSRGHDEATVWDRLFAFWFRRLVYTQIWEDPEADLAALRLPLGSTIVTISSGAALRPSLTGIQSYCSAKHALLGLTRQLAHDLAPDAPPSWWRTAAPTS